MRRLQRPIGVCVVVGGLSLSVLSAAATKPRIVFSRGEQQTQSSETDQLLRAALVSYQQGKFDEALANLNKAATLSPNDFRPLALSGYVYSAQRKLKSASQAFAAAIRLQPQRKELYLLKAEGEVQENIWAV